MKKKLLFIIFILTINTPIVSQFLISYEVFLDGKPSLDCATVKWADYSIEFWKVNTYSTLESMDFKCTSISCDGIDASFYTEILPTNFTLSYQITGDKVRANCSEYKSYNCESTETLGQLNSNTWDTDCNGSVYVGIQEFYNIVIPNTISCNGNTIPIIIKTPTISDDIQLIVTNVSAGQVKQITKPVVANNGLNDTIYFSYADLGLLATENWQDTELQIKILWPDKGATPTPDGNYSPSIGGIFFLKPPTLTFGLPEGPSCHDSTDAYIPMTLPSWPLEDTDSVMCQITVEKFTLDSVTGATAYIDPSDGQKIYLFDGKTAEKKFYHSDYGKTINIDNTFMDGKKVITNGYYRIAAKLFIKNKPSSLCTSVSKINIASPGKIEINTNNTNNTIDPSVIHTDAAKKDYHIKAFNGTGSTKPFNITGRNASATTYTLVSPTATTTPSSNPTLHYNTDGTFTVDGLLSGTGNNTIKVKTTDKNCPSTEMAVNKLVQPEELKFVTIYTPVTDVSCFGESTGAIKYNFSGGLSPYKVELLKKSLTGEFLAHETKENQPSGESSFSKLPSGFYKIQVTDTFKTKITSTTIFEIKQPDTDLTVSLASSRISWPGATDGKVTLSASGGNSSSYTYQLGTNPAVFNNIFNVGAITNQKFTVYDALTCSVKTSDITLTDPPAITITITPTPQTCYGTDGKISVVIGGGWADADYKVELLYKNDIFKDSKASVNPGTYEFTNVSADTYKIKVSPVSNPNKSLVSSDFTVARTNPITNLVSYNASTLKQESCIDKRDAEVEITGLHLLNGSYNVTGSEGLFNTLTHKISNLTAGDKVFTITEPTGRRCSTTITVPIVVNPGALEFVGISSASKASCLEVANATVRDSATSAFGNLTYSLWKGTTQIKPNQGTGFFSAIAADNTPSAFTYKVTDGAGCVIEKPKTIEADPNPIHLSTTATDASCTMHHDGVIGFKYLWHDKGKALTATLTSHNNLKTPITVNDAQSTTKFTGLPIDAYTLMVTDPVGCKFTHSNADTEIKDKKLYPSITIINTDSLACSSASNGIIKIGAKPGTPQSDPLTFTFTGASNSPKSISTDRIAPDTVIYSNLNAHLYSIKVTEANGCYSTDSSTVPVMLMPVKLINVTSTPSSCDASDNGTLSMAATGGKAFGYGYTFSVNAQNKNPKNGTSAMFDSIPNDIAPYIVTVTDSAGCNATQADSNTFVGTRSPQSFELFDNKISITPPTCQGYEDGSIEFGIHDPFNSAPYYYTLSTTDNIVKYSGTTNDTIPVKKKITLLGEVYNLKVTSKEGCSFVYNVIEVVDPSPIEVESEPAKVKDKGLSTGTITTEFTQGSNNYVYELTSPQNIVTTGTTTNNTKLFDNLPAGQYQFRLKDANNCLYFKDASNDSTEWYTEQIEITEPDSLLTLSVIPYHVSCNKFGNGSIKLNVSGGWPNANNGYLYSFNNGVSWSANDSIANLTPNICDIQIKDNEGVIRKDQVAITEPDTLNFSIIDQKDATCRAKENGYVVASTLSDGTPFANGLHYSIYSTSNTTTPVDAQSITNGTYRYGHLAKDSYTLWAEDKNGCKASKPFTIGAPDTVLISTTNNYIKAKYAATGVIDATITNGNHFYQYRWFKDDQTTPYESGTITNNLHQTNLVAGRYTLEVKDTANCKYEGTDWMSRIIEIKEPQAPIQVAIKSHLPASCKGFSNGLVELESSGGWGDYRYKIDNNNYTNSLVFDSLATGNYIFTVIDSAGIENSLTHFIQEPSLHLNATVDTISHVKCYNGTSGFIRLLVSGGNGNYQISTDSVNWISNSVVPGLNANDYTLFVKDYKDCNFRLGPIVVTEPDPITEATLPWIKESICEKDSGAIKNEFKGGTGQYSYSWERTYPSFNGTLKKDHLPQFTTPSIYHIYSGIYDLEIKDDNNCPFKFTYWVGDSSTLKISQILTDSVSCNGYSDGRAEATVIGGNQHINANGDAYYVYVWPIDTAQTSLLSPTSNGYFSGNYTLMVGDAKGCIDVKSFKINEPDTIGYQIIQQIQPLCLGGAKGTIELSATGGSPNYDYSWSTGSTNKAISELEPGNYNLTISDSHNCSNQFNFPMKYQRTIKPNLGSDIQLCHYNDLKLDAGDFSHYAWSSTNGFTSKNQKVTITNPGNYYLEVKDADNCLGLDTLKVEVSYLAIEKLSFSDVTCFGFANGLASINVTPANWSYATLWSNQKTTNEVNGLTKGEYTVKVSDAFGCNDTRTVKIEEPSALALSSRITYPLCLGVANGKIVVELDGGIKPYSYSWNNGLTASKLTSVDKGVYELNATDANGCLSNSKFDIGYQRTLPLNLGDDRVMCKNNQILLSPGFYSSYKWYNDALLVSQDSALVANSSANITLNVEDEDGCLATDQVKISQSEIGFSPQFLCASSVEVGDTLLVIEVSQPYPVSATWTLPLNHRVVEQSGATLKVIFDEEGAGDIKLTASTQSCVGESWKNILVFPAGAPEEPNVGAGNRGSKFIALTVTPNPSSGEFSANIKLKEVAPITLYLVDISTGQIINIQNLSGLKEYTKPYSFEGSARLAVFAECGGDRLVAKVLVH